MSNKTAERPVYTKVLIGVNPSKNNPNADQKRIWLKGSVKDIIASLGEKAITKRPLVEKVAKVKKEKKAKKVKAAKTDAPAA